MCVLYPRMMKIVDASQSEDRKMLKLAIYKMTVIPLLDQEFMLSLSEDEVRYVLEGDKTSSVTEKIDKVFTCSHAMAD